MTETKTLDSVEDTALYPESELVPLVTIAAELGEPIDVVVSRFGGYIKLNYWGARCVPAKMVMEHLARQWEWRQRHAAEVRQITEELASKPAPGSAGVPAQEGLTAAEVMMAQPGYQTPHDEFGRPKPNFLVDALDQGARTLAEEQRLNAERRELVKRMRDHLAGRS